MITTIRKQEATTPSAPGAPAPRSLDIKTIRMESSYPESEPSQESDIQSSEQAPLTSAERRAQRRQEFREAASIREKALKMQRQAEERFKQSENFASLMQQAKEDPSVLAQALGMDTFEFQKKLFNKMYSINEQEEVKEETFEEKTAKRMAQYEQELAFERQRREEETRQNQEREFQVIKKNYIIEHIIPCISEDHEFIHQNDKNVCASMIYDFMNHAYLEHKNKGGSDHDFNLSAQDIVDQMEEELAKQAEEQLSHAKNIKKLRKFFSEEPADQLKSSFSSSRSERSLEQERPTRSYASPPSAIHRGDEARKKVTLTNSMGFSSVPGSSQDFEAKRIPISDREARLDRVKRQLGKI